MSSSVQESINYIKYERVKVIQKHTPKSKEVALVGWCLQSLVIHYLQGRHCALSSRLQAVYKVDISYSF